MHLRALSLSFVCVCIACLSASVAVPVGSVFATGTALCFRICDVHGVMSCVVVSVHHVTERVYNGALYKILVI